MPEQRHHKNRSVIIERHLAAEALFLSTEEDEEDVEDHTTRHIESTALQRNYRNMKQGV